LYLLSDNDIIRITENDNIHISTYTLPGYRIISTKKINDNFFLVIENSSWPANRYELHKYNITNDSWELSIENYIQPSEKIPRSENKKLVDYLYDERHVYDYDLITGSKSIRFQFPEDFASPDQIDLLFKLGNTWYFNVKNDQYLIYNEN
jgi:hypothetical protein